MINILRIIWAIKMSIRCGKCLPKTHRKCDATTIHKLLSYAVRVVFYFFSLSSSLWNLLNFFRTSVCSLSRSVDVEFFFVYCKHIRIWCIIILKLLCLLACLYACMHACKFAASSYITYINLSENIPLSWCIHCTWISYNNKRNEWKNDEKTHTFE